MRISYHVVATGSWIRDVTSRGVGIVSDETIGRFDTDGGAQRPEVTIGGEMTFGGAFSEISLGMSIGPGDRYRIKDVLGRGGMGEVYLAEDKVSGADVALKLVPRDVAMSDGEMEQIRENFNLIRNLHHPHIAAVTNLERLRGSGEYFLVMEAVAGGKTLTRERPFRDQRRMPLEEAIEICRQVADALDYAHSRRIMHRDVKPDNVLIDPDDEVKVTDFGLAAQIVSSLSRVSQVEIDTSGTRPYMAPEQFLGGIQDGRTDQWALAVVFYELVAGRRPFPAADYEILRDQVLKVVPERPEGLGEQQWKAVLKALSKEKEDRFPSCVEFMDAVAGRVVGTVLRGGRVLPKEIEEGACWQCAYRNSGMARHCVQCGVGLFEKCPACGCEIKAGLSFCKDCGANLHEHREAAKRLDEARGLIERGAYAEAADLCRGLMHNEYAKEGARKLLEKASETLSEIDDLRAAALRREEENDIEGALDCLRELVERGVVEEEDTRRAAALEQRLAAFQGCVARAEAALRKKHFDEALREAGAAEACWPQNEATGALVERILDTQSRHAALRRWRPLVGGAVLLATAVAVWGAFGRGSHVSDPVGAPPGMVLVRADGGKPGLAFWCDVAEVTNGDYEQYVLAAGTAPPPHWRGRRCPAELRKLPVVNVTHKDAEGYARWAGKRLPSEEEWELAARGSGSDAYPWGDAFDGTLCNGRHSAAGRPVPADSAPAQRSELRHLIGNVWEMTSDRAGPLGYVIKGGSFLSSATLLSIDARQFIGAETRQADVGFRCVRNL